MGVGVNSKQEGRRGAGSDLDQGGKEAGLDPDQGWGTGSGVQPEGEGWDEWGRTPSGGGGGARRRGHGAGCGALSVSAPLRLSFLMSNLLVYHIFALSSCMGRNMCCETFCFFHAFYIYKKKKI